MRFPICLLPTLLALTALAAPDVAFVKKVQGAPRVVRGAEGLPATAGMKLFETDRIVLGAGETIGIVFNDGTRLSAGPSTELELRKYLFDPARSRFAFDLYLKKGTLAYSSGSLARLAPDAVRLETPRSTVGVRGTRFVLRHDVGGAP